MKGESNEGGRREEGYANISIKCSNKMKRNETTRKGEITKAAPKETRVNTCSKEKENRVGGEGRETETGKWPPRRGPGVGGGRTAKRCWKLIS